VPYTANEGPVRIQYKWLVPIYVFPEMKMLFPKQNYNVLSPSSYTHISVTDLYISTIGLLETEATQFQEKEYINGIFLAVRPRQPFLYCNCFSLLCDLIDELLEQGLLEWLPAVAPELVAPRLAGCVQRHLVHCPLRRRSEHTKHIFFTLICMGVGPKGPSFLEKLKTHF
jgi:hypothetical protein